MKNNKTYYQLNETDKFRTYVKPLSNGSYKYGIEKKITVFGINFWITIISYKSCTEPKFYIGCIPHPFKRIGEILNKVQCCN
jgi:hypothetical protein